MPADEVTQGDIPLELMQISLRPRLSPMPHGRHIKEEKKEYEFEISLDGSSHQTWDAAFTPATPHDLHHSRANTDSHNSHNTQHTRVKQIHFVLCKRALSPARHVLEGTSHQIRPKIDGDDASLLMGSIN
jgi:hypothetical protein